MNTTIKLPLPSFAKILVKVGDRITPKTVLGETGKEMREMIISLTHLLHVDPDKILKYLKVQVGQQATFGQVIAEKRNIFSSFYVKSPCKGLIKEIDLKKGTLTFVETDVGSLKKLILPFIGKVTKIEKNHLEVEVPGKVIEGVKGEGKEILGTLFFFPQDRVGLFDVKETVDGCIVFCRVLPAEVMVKLEVLGALGLIIVNFGKDISLPWVQIEEENAKKLKDLTGKKIFLRPQEKEIVILE